MPPFIAYYTVLSGSMKGVQKLSDQQMIVGRYEREHDVTILKKYRELLPRARHSKRPALRRALAHAKRSGAILLIPQFNPFARDIAFLSLLLESGVELRACDNPHVSKAAIPLLASVVGQTSRRISTRTKTALATRKRQRIKLGNPGNLTTDARKKGAAAMRQRRWDGVMLFGPRSKELRDQGKSLREIASILTAEGYPETVPSAFEEGPRRPWNHTSVRRLLARYEEWQGRRAQRR
jgi:DNA invertase Pin-like site-specific DNA recombinase